MEGIEDVANVAGLLIKITRQDTTAISSDDLNLEVKADGGWIEVREIKPQQLDHKALGVIDMFQIQGNIADFLIDDSATNVRSLDTYTGIGDMEVQYGDNGKLRMTGRADRLWKDKGRLNPTKWEKLGWEVKAFMLTLLGGVGLFLWTVLVRSLKSNQKFSWMT
jgi:hypothetical protein